MLELFTAAACGLALGLVLMVIAVVLIKRRERRKDDNFMFREDHWGAR